MAANYTSTGASVYQAGHIIQVVTGTFATETSTTSTSFVQINSALEPAITVTGSNKVYVMATVPAYSSGAGVGVSIQLFRGSTALGPASWGFGINIVDSSGGSNGGPFAASVVDTPGAGSHTYKVYHRVNNGTGYSCINTSRASITLFEIQA